MVRGIDEAETLAALDPSSWFELERGLMRVGDYFVRASTTA